MGILEKALARRIDAAQGKLPCDLVIRNVTWLDVFSCEWKTGDVAVNDGTIVATDAGLKAVREIEGRGKWLVPGFIDAHVHVESSLLTPNHFQDAVLPRGTTTAFCDPHELTNVIGISAIEYFLCASEKLAIDLRIMLSSCIPAATDLEINGAGVLSAADLKPFIKHPKVSGLAEMMNVPGLLAKDQSVLSKLAAFAGRRIDGHLPLVHGQALSACAAAGVSSCHESSDADEAKEKLSKGIAVWIREGSVAKDLDALAHLLTTATSTSIGFCTDDRNPWEIVHEGHIDHLVRRAIALGVTPEVAYRSAAWTPARHYGLSGLGAIAPGYAADLILLDDPRTVAIANVWKAGVPASELEGPSLDPIGKNSVRAEIPEAQALEGPKGRVHVIEVTSGRILTRRDVAQYNDPGIARLSVLERYGHHTPPANAYVRGFGKSFHGAIASSVGHDSHNLITVGDNTSDMRTALAALIQSQGGFCVVRDGKVLAKLALPIGGLMSELSAAELEPQIARLREASHETGCELAEPFLQLAFLSLPVIPSLKLTSKGLVDVERFEVIDVRAE